MIEVTKEDIPEPTDTTAQEESARLGAAIRTMQFGMVHARSNFSNYARRARQTLDLRQRWKGMTLDQVREKAALGCCSEVQQRGCHALGTLDHAAMAS